MTRYSLAEAQLTLADILGASMDFLAQMPVLTAERPNLPEWLARVGARYGFTRPSGRAWPRRPLSPEGDAGHNLRAPDLPADGGNE